MSDIGPYGTLQNPDENAVTADALVGERAGNVTAHQADAGYGPARFSTAPYIPPKSQDIPASPSGGDILPSTGPTCRFKNCKQSAADGSDYCERHQP